MTEASGNGKAVIEKATGDAYVEIGATGLRQYGGVIHEEFLRDLQGKKGRDVFREMSDNDPVIGAILFGIDMMVRQVEWHVEPHPDDPSGEDSADFVWSCFDDMASSWEDTLSEVLSMLPFGWSYFETVYKVRRGPAEEDPTFRSKHTDGRIGWRKFATRAQDTLLNWDFDENGGIQAMVQSAPPDYTPTPVPIAKSLLFRTQTRKGSPEGRSVLRNAYRPWYFKKRIEEIEGIGIERDLAGLPVAYVPARLFSPDASDADKQVLEAIQKRVRNIKRDEEEGVVFPSVFDDKGNQLYKLELLTTGGRRQFDTDATVARYDQRMAMVTLGDFILLGHERVGTQGLATTKTELFQLALSAWIDGIAEVFNSYGIPRLVALNGGDPSLAPSLIHDEVKQADLAELADYVERMAGAAVIVPGPRLDEWARDMAGLPSEDGGTEEL